MATPTITMAGANIVDKGVQAIVGGIGVNSFNLNLQLFGRQKNKLRPNPDAVGSHSTFKRDPDTGKITNYETYKVNPKHPSGFDLLI